MNCPKCHSDVIFSGSSWDLTESELNLRKASYLWHKAHPAGLLGTAAVAAVYVLKGMATNMNECRACKHRWRKLK